MHIHGSPFNALAAQEEYAARLGALRERKLPPKVERRKENDEETPDESADEQLPRRRDDPEPGAGGTFQFFA